MNNKLLVEKIKLPLVLLGLSAMMSGCSLLPIPLDKQNKTETDFEVRSEMSIPVYDDKGAVDQKAFEQQQTVEKKNDDLNTIEADLDSTVILKEDFSNL